MCGGVDKGQPAYQQMCKKDDTFGQQGDNFLPCVAIDGHKAVQPQQHTLTVVGQQLQQVWLRSVIFQFYVYSK